VGGRCVCFYSGGRWENPNYGVGYAFAEHPLGPWKDEGNVEGPRVLTTFAEQVIGPGHNSVVLGPDLLSHYIVYHGWDPACTARYPRIDRLEWIDGHPRVEGPTFAPTPAPPLPDLADWFDEAAPGPHWERAEPAWRRDEVRSEETRFAVEVGFRQQGPGVVLRVGSFDVAIEQDRLTVGKGAVSLPAGYRREAWHWVSVRRETDRLRVSLDEYPSLEVPLAQAEAGGLSLAGAEGTSYSHFALTRLLRACPNRQ
jgi:hypothetical protein